MITNISYRSRALLVGSFIAISLGGWSSQSSASECANGCGPDGWIFDILLVSWDQYFFAACQRHDQCYCYGSATYCKSRSQSDEEFRSDMHAVCSDLFFLLQPNCYAMADLAYLSVVEFGGDFVIPDSEQSCNDYDGLGGEWTCPEVNPPAVFVDGGFGGCPQHGTIDRPVTSVQEGAFLVGDHGTVYIGSGTYAEALEINTPMDLQAINGDILINPSATVHLLATSTSSDQDAGEPAMETESYDAKPVTISSSSTEEPVRIEMPLRTY